MTPVERQKVHDEASAASEIATVLKYLAMGLAADPDTALIAEAINGVERLALMLTNRLSRFADADA